MRVTEWIGETWTDVSRALGIGPTWNALRSFFRWDNSFFGRPLYEHTTVNYDLARQLYRNDGCDTHYGAGFARPIIDLSVEYMGLPAVTSDNGDRDTFLNECIQRWSADLQEVFRNSIRDSKSIIRFRQSNLDNPLFTEKDRSHGSIQCLPPEVVDIVWNPSDPDLIDKCVIHHEVEFDERTDDEIFKGKPPRIKVHEVIEIIDRDNYRFFDKTMDVALDSWGTANSWGFVPVWPVWNEYDSVLGGGQSDLEPVLPFIRAFHDVFLQSLTSHKYHSSPKAKFNLKDINAFLKNNYPESIDPSTGSPKAGAKIGLTGREVYFLQPDEDVEFVEATSVLGDSKTLMDFIIDCIAIAAETPRWALLKESKVLATDASVQPFEKKIERKRVAFAPVVQMLVKMVSVVGNEAPETVRVTWPAISIDTLIGKGQAIQQIIMGLDVATAHEWIADETVRQILATLFPEMNAPEVEKRLAASNVVPEIPAPAPPSDTQAANGNGNGSKKNAKKAVKRAVGTTKASNS